jgi:hypothetical protein
LMDLVFRVTWVSLSSRLVADSVLLIRRCAWPPMPFA